MPIRYSKLLRLERVTDPPSATDESSGLQLLCPGCSAVRMVLAFQGVALGEEELCSLLDTQQVGTPVLNVLLLSQRVAGCHAEVTSASFADLARWLQEGIPPLVFVSTSPLRYWQTECLHALVVVEAGEQTVLVHDPAFAIAPMTIPGDEFLTAWGELAQLTALVRVSS